MMRILVACEESQRVTRAFREKGHEAYSCDVIDCSGGHPEWHIKEDVLKVLNGKCFFRTCDGKTRRILGQWDMIIAFPPCTYLTVTGNRWFNTEVYGKSAEERLEKRALAMEFFLRIAHADCDRIVIENPVGYMNSHFRKPNQIIQPYQFGDPFEKRTCLWLKNVPELTYTNVVTPPPRQVLRSGKTMAKWYSNCGKDRAKVRSKTFEGIATAMAEQWG